MGLDNSIVDTERWWLVELSQYLLLLVEVILESPNRKLEELILPLGLDNLVL